MTYQHRLAGAVWALVLVVLAIGGALLFETAVGGDDALPPWLVLVWLGIMAWNTYWWLLRIPIRLTVDAEALTWEAPLRSGRIPLAEIVRVRPRRLSSNVVVVEHVGGRPVSILAGKGFRRVLTELAKLRPDLPMNLGWQARLAERFPGPMAWRERHPRDGEGR